MGRQSLAKIFIGLCFALPLLFFTVKVGEARSRVQEAEPTPTNTESCQSCHADTHDDWMDSMHGQATDNRAFLLEWKKDGNPEECLACHTTGFDPITGEWDADGITCESCHSPAPADHPQEIMPTKATAEDCGTCHVDTELQWRTSGHGQQDLSCVNCHNAHTTGIRANDPQELCRTCHNQESHFYELTAHAEQGLQCTDCHLRVTDASSGEGHGQRIHTFGVDLRSCTQCHGEEMHYPVEDAMSSPQEVAMTVDETTLEATPAAQPPAPALADEPQPASETNYILAVTVGLALGIIVAPGLDHLYRRVTRSRRE